MAIWGILNIWLCGRRKMLSMIPIFLGGYALLVFRFKNVRRILSVCGMTAMIVLGTELESKPRGMPGPDDNAWIEEYSLLVNDIHPENKAWRYLTWVKFKAMTDEADMAKVQEVVGALSGVRESSVSAAEDFPGRDTEGR